MKKVHLKDQRLRVNAGMDFPTCRANEKLLDLEACRLIMTSDIHAVTCKHCKKIYFKGEQND